MGSTIVDSLSSLWLLGLHNEFQNATEWVEKSLTFNSSNTFTSFFEVNIRILGGLISAYELSGQKVFLDRAEELGKIMARGFDSKGFPPSYYNFATGEGNTRKKLRTYSIYGPIYGPGYYSLAELGTLSLEFSALGHHLKQDHYKHLGSQAVNLILNSFDPGIFPNGIYNDLSHTNTYSVAGEGDSFYEYLVKEYLHTGSKNTDLEKAAINSIIDIIEKLLQQDVAGYYYLGLIKDGEFISQMDHLACFFPGTFVLAAERLEFSNKERLITIAKELAFTCYSMYEQSESGLASENVNLHYGIKYPWFIDNHYALRPETLESLWYLYDLTKDNIYREWAWNIFQAIEKHAKNDVGYAEIENVNRNPPNQRGCLPSYFFSETLKYLYMIFSDEEIIDLNTWVFTTEGHPLKIKTDYTNPNLN